MFGVGVREQIGDSEEGNVDVDGVVMIIGFVVA